MITHVDDWHAMPSSERIAAVYAAYGDHWWKECCQLLEALWAAGGEASAEAVRQRLPAPDHTRWQVVAGRFAELDQIVEQVATVDGETVFGFLPQYVCAVEALLAEAAAEGNDSV